MSKYQSSKNAAFAMRQCKKSKYRYGKLFQNFFAKALLTRNATKILQGTRCLEPEMFFVISFRWRISMI